jgi:hypothetical protein
LLLAILVAALIASRCTGVILPIGIIKRNTLLAMSVALMLSPPSPCRNTLPAFQDPGSL